MHGVHELSLEEEDCCDDRRMGSSSQDLFFSIRGWMAAVLNVFHLRCLHESCTFGWGERQSHPVQSGGMVTMTVQWALKSLQALMVNLPIKDLLVSSKCSQNGLISFLKCLIPKTNMKNTSSLFFRYNIFVRRRKPSKPNKIQMKHLRKQCIIQSYQLT
jgi:hypothetical protein